MDSAYHVWVNGKQIGYSQGSRNAAEFDISNVIRKDDLNTLMVKVYQWSDGSYIEDQDMWVCTSRIVISYSVDDLGRETCFGSGRKAEKKMPFVLLRVVLSVSFMSRERHADSSILTSGCPVSISRHLSRAS